MDFGRVLTAMVTPFDTDGKINFEETTELIEYLLANGTEGLIISGTTGESPTLSNEEKTVLLKHTLKVVKGRVPVIAGTGSNHTHASIQATKKAEEAGADGVLLVVPYYNKPSQKGIYNHFATIANATNLPVILYNIPGRSIVNMETETIVDLSEIDNIVSLKEAGTDLDQVARVIEGTPRDFSVYSGNDNMTLPMMSLGANGVISVASHIIGSEMSEMINFFNTGKTKAAAAMHRKLHPLMKALFRQPSPAPVKAALVLKQVINAESLRLPLVKLSEEEKNELEIIIKNIGRR